MGVEGKENMTVESFEVDKEDQRYVRQGHDCTDSGWDRWRPPIYHYAWGYSVTRGCLFAWFCFALPTILYKLYSKKSAKWVYEKFEPTPNDCYSQTFTCVLAAIPLTIIAVIWVICIIILCIPWAILYIIGAIIETIVSLIYNFFTCCKGMKKEKRWRSFGFHGWLDKEWNEGTDPYTDALWTDWSPCRTSCDYNYPPI